MDALEDLLRAHGFRGRARRVRCFAHTLNLAAKATIRQFERKKGNQKKRQDNNDEPDFEELPLLESITEDESDDELDDDPDLVEIPELIDIEEDAEDGSNQAVRDEEEIVNVFATLTDEEKERWKMEVKPIRSALSKVSVSEVTWHLLT
jgi:Fe-S cluster assembly scaffold protein SufB